jgi:hypothetical protein
MWDDVIRTCSNRRIFCDSACVDTWAAREGLERGYVMDLAAAFFREVGLDGPFWGLS